MKYLATFLSFFICISTTLFSQNPITVNDATLSVVTVAPAQSFYLDSRIVSNINGHSRLTIPVNLPENTVKWYYSFAAMESKNEPLEWIGLAGQLTKLYDKTGIASEVINRLVKPSGTSSCDVFVLDTEGGTTFLNKDDVNLKFEKQYSRQNITGGVVEVPFTVRNPILGLSNSSVKSGINIKVEITAIVSKAKEINKAEAAQKSSTWNTTQRNDLFKKMEYCFDGKKNYMTDAVSICAVDSMSRTYSLDEYNRLMDSEKNFRIISMLQECFSKTQNQSLGIEMGEVALMKTKRDSLESAGNFKEMLVAAQTIVDWGYPSVQNRSKLIRAYILSGNSDKALAMADPMVRLMPDDMYLNLQLAHAYLFNNQYDRAEKQYLKYKTKVNADGFSWEQIVKNDFNFFIKNKVFNSQFDNIKKKLKIKG